MGYREVKACDGEFATREQILCGDPAAPQFPEETWLKHVGAEEFAVRYKDFKTGLPRSPKGELVGRSAEVCRIFDTFEEARAHSKETTEAHWPVLCFIYDRSGKLVASVSNQKQTIKYALATYAGILIWIAMPTALATCVLWLADQAIRVVLFPRYTGSLGWAAWFALGFVGLAAAIGVWWLKLQLLANRHAKKIKSAIRPEERQRFEELNTLFGTSDPAERERFWRLTKELEARVQQALKK